MQLHPIRKLVGRFVMGQNFNGGDDFDISLKDLPHHIQQGVGHLTELELILTGTFSTADGSAKIKSSDLHGWLDWSFKGVEDFQHMTREGWMDPIREAMKNGYVSGKRANDIPANATGNRVAVANVKLTKHLTFVEENWGPQSQLARCIPTIALAKANAKVRIHAFNADRTVRPATAAATGKWDALTVELWAHIIDLPSAVTNMPIMVEEGFALGKKELQPTPGNGMYTRLLLCNSPFFATTEDDVGGYDHINWFGVPGAYSVYEEDVDVVKRDFHAELTDALEPHRPTDAVLTNQKREFRILDEHENDDGVNRGIPLVRLRPGQEVSDAPRWYGNEPTLRANDDSTAGLPASVSFLFDRVMPRDPKHVTAILTALGPKARSKRPTVRDAWRGRVGVEVERIPLVVDARE